MNCHLVRQSQFAGRKIRRISICAEPCKLVLAYQLDKNGEAPLLVPPKTKFWEPPPGKGILCISSAVFQRFNGNGITYSPSMNYSLSFSQNRGIIQTQMKTYKSVFRKGCPVTMAFDRHGKIKPIYCGKWDCKRCAKHNGKMWAWRAFIGVEKADHQAWMWTLTMSGKIRSRKFAYSILPKLWKNLQQAMKRAFGGKWSYVAFVEGQPHRYGMPHFHVISLRKAPKRLKDMAVKAGFGHQAKERAIDGKGAAFYVAKYSSKGDGLMPIKFRRCRTSQDWPKLPDYEGAAYMVPQKTESTVDFLLRVHNATGVDMALLGDRWLDAWDDIQDLDKL